MEECLKRTKEEPPASKFHGLLAKTTLSIPVAQLTDNNYLHLGKGGDSFESHDYSHSVRHGSKAVTLHWETTLPPRGMPTSADVFSSCNWGDATGT